MENLIISAVLLVIGFIFGGIREQQHFKKLKIREKKLLHRLPTRSSSGPKLEAGHTFLVTGSVVIASDYFKNFLGLLKSFFGGSMAAQEALLDRARREAVCRLREQALELGAKEVIDLHIETVFLDNVGVEVSAYATAVR